MQTDCLKECILLNSISKILIRSECEQENCETDFSYIKFNYKSHTHRNSAFFLYNNNSDITMKKNSVCVCKLEKFQWMQFDKVFIICAIY